MKTLNNSELSKSFDLALAGIGNDFVNELVRTAPVDTGFLRNSISYEVENKGVSVRMPSYAWHVEYGTRPHKIRPRNAKVLHWKNGGTDVFATAVNHPGTVPQPFIRAAIYGKLRDIVRENLKRQLS
jgi:hypothetical protein